MLPGPTLVKSCPHCLKQYLQETLESGNTFGAVLWSDGKRDAPMLPEEPWLVLCPHCRAPLWLDEIEAVGEVIPGREDKSVHGEAVPFALPDADDYFGLLAHGLPAEKEKYVRIRAWWKENDARRDRSEEAPLSSRERANLEALAGLLGESDGSELLMKAEIMRELGRFDEAQALLDRPVDAGLAKVVDTFRQLVKSRDCCVRKLQIT